MILLALSVDLVSPCWLRSIVGSLSVCLCVFVFSRQRHHDVQMLRISLREKFVSVLSLADSISPLSII